VTMLQPCARGSGGTGPLIELWSR